MQLLKQKRLGGGESFVDRGVQTYDLGNKNKEVQATPPPTDTASTQASIYDIADTFNQYIQSTTSCSNELT